MEMTEHSAQELRFEVFNLELHEGLAESYTSGMDQDAFDQVCDHLLVRYAPTQQVVGTYRLLSGQVADKNLGYYSAQEFDLSPLELDRDHGLRGVVRRSRLPGT